MLFMVIERFKHGDFKAVGERFKRQGRMMPDDIAYVASWVEPSGASCFQLMQAPNEHSLAPWIACWSDLVDFQILPVQTSADFWAGVGQNSPSSGAPGPGA